MRPNPFPPLIWNSQLGPIELFVAEPGYDTEEAMRDVVKFCAERLYPPPSRLPITMRLLRSIEGRVKLVDE